MAPTFSFNFEHPSYSGKVTFPAGLFFDGKFSAGAEGKLIECVLLLYPLSDPRVDDSCFTAC